jgi:hypothetical protein
MERIRIPGPKDQRVFSLIGKPNYIAYSIRESRKAFRQRVECKLLTRILMDLGPKTRICLARHSHHQKKPSIRSTHLKSISNHDMSRITPLFCFMNLFISHFRILSASGSSTIDATAKEVNDVRVKKP